ncbi:MAG: DbpA RNA binding domain-containing protein, partial [Burkholderiaceae bacterium]
EKVRVSKKDRARKDNDVPMQNYRIEVGSTHGAKPANIVGAIANEAGLEAKYIGRIEIFDNYSTLDLPDGMPKELLEHLKTVWVAGQPLRISAVGGSAPTGDKVLNKKVTLTAPNKGVERRLNEKKFGDKSGNKSPSKSTSGFVKRSDHAAKPPPKPHRKGLKAG